MEAIGDGLRWLLEAACIEAAHALEPRQFVRASRGERVYRAVVL